MPQCEENQVWIALEIKALHDVVLVEFHRFLSYMQNIGYLLHVLSFGKKLQEISLTLCFFF